MLTYSSSAYDRSQVQYEAGSSYSDWQKLPYEYLKMGNSEDFASVRGYTSNNYKEINNNLQKNPVPTKWEYTSKCAASGVSRLPKYQGITYRGWKNMVKKNEPVSKWNMGQIWTTASFLSTTTDLNVAYVFADWLYYPSLGSGNLSIVWIIWPSSGSYIRSLSKFPSEYEVLQNPETSYKILDYYEYWTQNRAEIYVYETTNGVKSKSEEDKILQRLKS
ncbi:MAG: ADP-ribosyltransferase, partial [Nitrososphaerota archaeon]